MTTHSRWRRLATGPALPAAFIIMWTSGFIAGPIGVSVAPPLALTFWRFAVAATVLTVIAVATRAPWPRDRTTWIQLISTGVLMQAVMFGGAYLGMSMGVSAGLAALISGASPIVIAAAGTIVLKERLRLTQWLGTVVGFIGIAIAVTDEIGGIGIGIAMSILGTLGFSAGTLIQRRTGTRMDLRTGAAVQLIAATIAIAPVTAIHDGLAIPVTTTSLASVAWLALGNSGISFALMFLMLRHRNAADVTRSMLLVPPLAAIAAWPLLQQRPHLLIWAGLVVTGIGVAIASRQPRNAAPTDQDAGTENPNGSSKRCAANTSGSPKMSAVAPSAATLP